MNNRRVMGVGIPTLMVALTMLTLTAFASLSLVSAGADLRMSRRLAQSALAYAEADAAAERQLALLDEVFMTAQAQSDSEEQYLEQCLRLASGQDGGFMDENCQYWVLQGDVCVFSIAVDERHALEVTLRLQYDRDTRLLVEGWQLVDTQPWEEQYQGLPVWTGE